MSGSTNKKVLVARVDRETLAGFVQTPSGFGVDRLELMTPEGNILQIPYSDIKAVCFVRDFEGGETWREHRGFATRPVPGLWLRLLFRDGDSIEGIAPNNLMLVEAAGFAIVPPDPTFQNQRIFVPRAALSNVQVLGVIGSPLRRRMRKPSDEKKQDQLEMFGEG